MGKGYLKKAFEELDRANQAISKKRPQAQLLFEKKHPTNLGAELLKIYRASNDKKLCNLINVRKSLLFHPLVQVYIEKAIRNELFDGSSSFLKKLGEAIKLPPKRKRKSDLMPLNLYLFERELLGFDFDNDDEVKEMRRNMVRVFDKYPQHESHRVTILINDHHRFHEHLVRSGLRKKQKK